MPSYEELLTPPACPRERPGGDWWVGLPVRADLPRSLVNQRPKKICRHVSNMGVLPEIGNERNKHSSHWSLAHKPVLPKSGFLFLFSSWRLPRMPWWQPAVGPWGAGRVFGVMPRAF